MDVNEHHTHKVSQCKSGIVFRLKRLQCLVRDWCLQWDSIQLDSFWASTIANHIYKHTIPYTKMLYTHTHPISISLHLQTIRTNESIILKGIMRTSWSRRFFKFMDENTFFFFIYFFFRWWHTQMRKWIKRNKREKDNEERKIGGLWKVNISFDDIMNFCNDQTKYNRMNAFTLKKKIVYVDMHTLLFTPLFITDNQLKWFKLKTYNRESCDFLWK